MEETDILLIAWGALVKGRPIVCQSNILPYDYVLRGMTEEMIKKEYGALYI